MGKRLRAIPTTPRGWTMIQKKGQPISVCRPAATALTAATRKAIRIARKLPKSVRGGCIPDKIWKKYVMPVHNRYGNKCATSDTMVRDISWEVFIKRADPGRYEARQKEMDAMFEKLKQRRKWWRRK